VSLHTCCEHSGPLLSRAALSPPGRAHAPPHRPWFGFAGTHHDDRAGTFREGGSARHRRQHHSGRGQGLFLRLSRLNQSRHAIAAAVVPACTHYQLAPVTTSKVLMLTLSYDRSACTALGSSGVGCWHRSSSHQGFWAASAEISVRARCWCGRCGRRAGGYTRPLLCST
jgi:hypothetical protein